MIYGNILIRSLPDDADVFEFYRIGSGSPQLIAKGQRISETNPFKFGLPVGSFIVFDEGNLSDYDAVLCMNVYWCYRASMNCVVPKVFLQHS